MRDLRGLRPYPTSRRQRPIQRRNRNDVVVDDDRIREARSVEVAVNLRRDDSLAVAVGDGQDFEGDLRSENLSVAPCPDRSGIAELPAGIVDNRSLSEEGVVCERIGAVDRPADVTT